MDKLVIGFFADILYNKQIINASEYDAILDMEVPSDMDYVLDGIENCTLGPVRRGEGYVHKKH